MIPIFCINLERAIERKDSIQKEWIDKIGLDIIFWKAYDRRDIELNIYPYPYNKDLTIKNLKRELSSGEIACSTSFCMLYEHILDNNYEEVIIMEDDIFPLIKNKQELFEKIIEGKKEYSESNFMILHRKKNLIKTQKIISQKKYFSEINPVPWGNMLIYLDKTAIKKTYEILKQMICPADNAQRILFDKKELNVIVVNDSLCRHDTDNTYIGNDFRNSHRNFIK